MEFDELKTVWKQEINMKAKDTNFETIRKDVDRFDRNAKLDWGLEILACSSIGGISIWWWFRNLDANLLIRVGIAAMGLVAIWAVGKMILGRRVKTLDDWTLVSKLNVQIEKRENEARITKNALYWGLIPILCAMVLLSYGVAVKENGHYYPDLELLISWGLGVVAIIGIRWLNRRRIRKKYQPLLEKLYTLKQQLLEG